MLACLSSVDRLAMRQRLPNGVFLFVAASTAVLRGPDAVLSAHAASRPRLHSRARAANLELALNLVF